MDPNEKPDPDDTTPLSEEEMMGDGAAPLDERVGDGVVRPLTDEDDA